MNTKPKTFSMSFRKEAMPTVKGEEMSKKDKKMDFPAFPKPEDFDCDWSWDKSDMKAFWEKAIDFQKSSVDASKDNFDEFFSYYQDMMDDFAAFLPD